ncbi:MAG: hypothetical protein WAZ12_00015 [Candidatus Absconditicoccaceae bacterium]
MNKTVSLENDLWKASIKKSDLTINNQAKDFLDYLGRIGTLKNDTKKNLMETINISSGFRKLISIFELGRFDMDKKELILMLSSVEDDVLKQMKKVRLKNAKSQEYYVGKIKEIYGSEWNKYNIDNLVTAYRFYEKYKEFLAKEQVNKTTLGHTLKYNTSVQHIKHRMPNGEGKFGTGDYFFDTDEQFVMMDENKNNAKMSINKYFGPIWIRIKEATDNTINNVEEINKYNPEKKGIKINKGDYIVELDISPHEFNGGKPLQEAYKQLAEYLKNNAYDEIMQNNLSKGRIMTVDNIHIPFVFGITALTTFAKRGGREIRKIPLELAKKTSTYMYGLFNPHGKYTEQPALLKFTNPLAYRQLERMSDKYDARDISFVYIDSKKFILENN